MFSQSFLIGENTLQELEKIDKLSSPKQKPESHDIIDESPTNLNATHRSIRSRIVSIKTQNKSYRKKGIKRNKSDSILNGSIGAAGFSKTENYSEFFRTSKDNVFQNEIAPIQNSVTSTLDKYFKDSFNFVIKTPIEKVEIKPHNDILPLQKDVAIPTEKDLNEMFDKSDFFTQQNDSNVDSNLHDLPIYVPKSSENITWEESVDFNNIINNLNSDSDSTIKKSKEISLMVDDDVALGLDNITFIHDFLKQRSFENDLNLKSQKSIRQFIQEEMHQCSHSVLKDASIHETSINESVHLNVTRNSNNLSNLVLNWSSESLPPNVKNPSKVKETTTQVQRTVPATNSIADWGLSKAIVEEYYRKGIRTMFQWQVDCLSNTRVLFDRENLVYSAPTSAGKTLVSELLMIKNVLEYKKKSLLILPFISVVREKMFYLKDLLAPAGLCVEGFFGGYTPPCAFDKVDIAVCTIEKANSIVNKLLEQNKIEQLGCIVVDEVHLISDPGRGYILELLIAKILYVCQQYGHRIQIITMSATLPNLDLLTNWLKAQFFLTDFRPVALTEMIKIENRICDVDMKELRVLNTTEYTQYSKDPDGVGQLCIETILEGCSVIIFCPSKDWCEALSKHVAGFIYSIGKSKTILGEKVREHLNMELIEETKMQLRNCESGLDSILEQSISYGCAFHHAGLTMDERDIIESAFKNGALRVIVATSTLSSGVNLPARRVIIRTPMFGGKPMNSLTYKQMIGRAGRMGKDTLGESILICGQGQVTTGKNLIGAKLQPLTSCLAADSHVNLKRAILEIIASGMAKTSTDLEQFANCTLLASEHDICFAYDGSVRNRSQIVSKSLVANDDPISNCMEFLIKYEFIRLQLNEETNEMNFMATRLGAACLNSSMPPGDGFLLFSELQKSRQCFVLESELHAVYLVTPFSVCYQMNDIDWMFFLDMWEKIPTAMRRVGEMVGVKESFLVKAVRGHKLDFKVLQIHKRFYTALALQELVNEVHVNVVAAKFKCSRGLLQSLQQMASTFAGVVTSFCNALQWNMLALIISQFKERLFFGVHYTLIDLMKISNLNGQRARAFFDAGYQSLADLANADVFSIEKILYNSMSFDSKQREGENEFDAVKRNKIRFLHMTGKSGITIRDAAKSIIEEARNYLQMEMGIEQVKWAQIKDEQSNEIVIQKKIEISDKMSDNVQLTEKENLNHIKMPPPNNIIESSEHLSSTRQNIIKETAPINTFQNAKENLKPSEVKMFPTNQPINTIEQSEDLFESQENPNYIRKISPVNNAKHVKITAIPPQQKEIRKVLTVEKLPDKLNISSESCDEILQTPKPIQKTQSRVLKSKIKRKNTQQKYETQIPVENIMVNQVIDVNDFDSIKLSLSNVTNSSKNREIIKKPDIKSHKSDLHIIDVFENEQNIQNFLKKLEQSTEIGLAVGLDQNVSPPKVTIGGHLLQNENITVPDQFNCTFDNFYIDGISVCFNEPSTAYYLNLQDGSLTLAKRIKYLEQLFSSSDLTVKMLDAKEQFKILTKAMDLHSFNGKYEDPRVANWLLHPDFYPSLMEMAQKYSPECISVLNNVEEQTDCKSACGLNYSSSTSAKIRASVECCVLAPILRIQKENLQKINKGYIFTAFIEMEMPIQGSLFAMETKGFAADYKKLFELGEHLKDIMKILEANIFKMNCRKFNIASSTEVAKVLGMRQKASTSKAVLNKMSDPMSDLIVQWRKLGGILYKNIRPLMECVKNNRIHGNSMSFTSTGRISMHEPNLQNIARDFDMEIDSKTYPISCRTCFSPESGRSIISADFCQLELRILTHLSQDSALTQVMHSAQDIFTLIAAKWNKIEESKVSDKQRHDTKQICYGIIYGMGSRALADALKCDESSAMFLSESFHQTYPGIRSYTDKIVRYVRQEGYVETLAGRRRYLPTINSDDSAIRAQAERQAINTTIQGSAADVAKYAILRMERNLRKYETMLKVNISEIPKSSVDFVLHLHDELLYEVPSDKARQVGKILKSSMENCAKLNVPLKVKLKIGLSWGELEVTDV